MSTGKSWSAGYRPSRYGYRGGRADGPISHACPNGRAKCWLCSRPDLASYRDAKSSPLSDSWDM